MTYIEDLQAVADSDPFDSQGVAQVNGVSYPHSQGAQFCFGSNERKWTYVLGRKYSTLQGTIGLTDNSVPTAKIRFDVLADGRRVYSKDLTGAVFMGIGLGRTRLRRDPHPRHPAALTL